MSRGLSARMTTILDFLESRGVEGLPFTTTTEVVLDLYSSDPFLSDFFRERGVWWSAEYRSVWRTMRLLETRGLVRRGAQLKRRQTGWVLAAQECDSESDGRIL